MNKPELRKSDMRTLANNIAQRLQSDFDVCPQTNDDSSNELVPESVLTSVIAEEVERFFA